MLAVQVGANQVAKAWLACKGEFSASGHMMLTRESTVYQFPLWSHKYFNRRKARSPSCSSTTCRPMRTCRGVSETTSSSSGSAGVMVPPVSEATRNRTRHPSSVRPKKISSPWVNGTDRFSTSDWLTTVPNLLWSARTSWSP